MGFECPIQTPKSTLYRWMRRWRVDVMFFLCNNFSLLTYFFVRSLNLGEGREKQVRNQVMSGTSGNSLKGWSTRFFVTSRTRTLYIPSRYQLMGLCISAPSACIPIYIGAIYILQWNFIEISMKFHWKFHWNFNWNFKKTSIEISFWLKLLWNFIEI